LEIAEQERRIDERRRLGEGRHVRRRDDAVVDRDALVHVGEIVLLQAELAVAVEHELDRLAVVFLDKLLELDERLVEGVVVVELYRAVQRDRLLRVRRRRNGCRRGHRRERQTSPDGTEHAVLPGSLLCRWAPVYGRADGCPRGIGDPRPRLYRAPPRAPKVG